MDQRRHPLSTPFAPTARQFVHIIISTKLRFQGRIRHLFGEAALAAINASIKPFILPIINYNLAFDIFIFILF